MASDEELSGLGSKLTIGIRYQGGSKRMPCSMWDKRKASFPGGRRLIADIGLALMTLVPMGTAFGSPVTSQAWFEQLDADTRVRVQMELVLTAHYGSMIDGEFGHGTLVAIQAFERSIAHSPDGVLDDAEMRSLQGQAEREADMLGLSETTDPRGSLSFLLATKLLISKAEKSDRVVYSSSDGKIGLSVWSKSQSAEPFEATFGKAVTAGQHRVVTYSRLSDDAFTSTGTNNGAYFYTRGIRGHGQTVGFTLQYGNSYQKTGGVLATLLASLSRIPDQSDETPAPPLAPKTHSAVSSGSGFFISSNGMILTNYHVAGQCAALEVPGYGSASLLKGDPDVDLAVIQLDRKRQTSWAAIRKDPVRLAESVVLVGYPLADLLDSALNVSTGVVSSLTGIGGDSEWFTTNAGIQPGNSGGPILDARGAVVGIAVAKMDEAKMLSENGTVAPNVGFGIKSSDILKFVSIFDHSETPQSSGPTLNAQTIAIKATEFTVQVVCTGATASN